MEYFAFAILGFAIALVFAILTDGWSRKVNRKDKEIMRLERELSEAKRKLENPLLEYGLDGLECENYHLSGDCPLCGAK